MSHLVLSKPETNKAFSTKEAALKFIEENNKPKEIVLFEDEVKVCKTGFIFRQREATAGVCSFTDKELEQIYKAWQSLQ